MSETSDLHLAMLHFGRWMARHGVEADKISLVVQCAPGNSGCQLERALKHDFDHAWVSTRDFKSFTLAGIRMEFRYLPSEIARWAQR